LALFTKGDERGVLSLEALDVLELNWRVLGVVENLGSVLETGCATGIGKLLEEDLGKDRIGIVLEGGRENDGNTVVEGLEKEYDF